MDCRLVEVLLLPHFAIHHVKKLIRWVHKCTNWRWHGYGQNKIFPVTRTNRIVCYRDAAKIFMKLKELRDKVAVRTVVLHLENNRDSASCINAVATSKSSIVLS